MKNNLSKSLIDKYQFNKQITQLYHKTELKKKTKTNRTEYNYRCNEEMCHYAVMFVRILNGIMAVLSI